jgi:glycosyltransferase involved in cell wall biosynthesis
METSPLVSVVVITYNSAKYVLETLESAKTQTYQNIELIISDDGSKDGTIEICREWLNDNKDWFVYTKLITVENNTGIAPNLNRGIKASNGEWIKSIAGDDILKPTIITDYLAYIDSSSSEINFIYSNVQEFIDEDGDRKFLPIKSLSKEKINDSMISIDDQLKILVYSNTVWAATWFYSRKLFDQLNGFNEQYPFFEDRPFLVSVLKNKNKIFYLNKIGAFYRRSYQSIQFSNEILSIHNENKYRYKLDVLSEFLENHETLNLKKEYHSLLHVSKIFGNRKSIISQAYLRLILKLGLLRF